MDPKYIALIVMASCAAGALMVWSIADAVVRYAEIRRRKDASVSAGEVSERLARIESAIDVMSVELERIGELHRFNAQLSQGRVPAELVPPQIQGRIVTPH